LPRAHPGPEGIPQGHIGACGTNPGTMKVKQDIFGPGLSVVARFRAWGLPPPLWKFPIVSGLLSISSFVRGPIPRSLHPRSVRIPVLGGIPDIALRRDLRLRSGQPPDCITRRPPRVFSPAGMRGATDEIRYHSTPDPGSKKTVMFLPHESASGAVEGAKSPGGHRSGFQGRSTPAPRQ